MLVHVLGGLLHRPVNSLVGRAGASRLLHQRLGPLLGCSRLCLQVDRLQLVLMAFLLVAVFTCGVCQRQQRLSLCLLAGSLLLLFGSLAGRFLLFLGEQAHQLLPQVDCPQQRHGGVEARAQAQFLESALLHRLAQGRVVEAMRGGHLLGRLQAGNPLVQAQQRVLEQAAGRRVLLLRWLHRLPGDLDIG